MTFEKKLNNQYRKVAQQISNMIPVEWSKFYFNGEVKDGEGGVYFFFTPKNESNKNIYGHYIPKLYGVDKKEYNKALHDLFQLTLELQQIFTDNQQEPWYSITLIVTSEGKLNVHFDYIDWSKTEYGPSTRIEYFGYKYMNKEPDNKKDKEMIVKMKEYEQKHSS